MYIYIADERSWLQLLHTWTGERERDRESTTVNLNVQDGVLLLTCQEEIEKKAVFEVTLGSTLHVCDIAYVVFKPSCTAVPAISTLKLAEKLQ